MLKMGKEPIYKKRKEPADINYFIGWALEGNVGPPFQWLGTCAHYQRLYPRSSQEPMAAEMQPYLTESKLPPFLWYSLKGYIYCETTKYNSWHISTLVGSSTTCKLIIILVIHGRSQAFLTASYGTAACVEMDPCVCLYKTHYCLVSTQPYSFKWHFQMLGFLPSKAATDLFWSHCSLTGWQSSLLTSQGELVCNSLLLAIILPSPVALYWLCTPYLLNNKHADYKCPTNSKAECRWIIWRWSGHKSG